MDGKVCVEISIEEVSQAWTVGIAKVGDEPTIMQKGILARACKGSSGHLKNA